MYKEKIILFGTGLSSERFYYEYYDKISKQLNELALKEFDNFI